MSQFTAIVLAAGRGTRMRSALPKALHEICGRAMVLWPVRAAIEAGAANVVVVDAPGRPLQQAMPEGVDLVVQPVPDGTGGAVRAAASHIAAERPVLVLSGDVPLLSAEAIAGLVAAHVKAGAAASVMSAVLEDPSGYGRIVRAADGTLQRIVETKAAGDASEQEMAIDEVNAGVYLFEAGPLLDALPRLTAANAQGELYLPQALEPIIAAGGAVAVHAVQDPRAMMGVNDRAALAEVTAIARRAINERHMRAGATILDPQSTWIDVDVQIGADAVIEPGTQLRGATAIGAGAHIGPHCVLIDTRVGEGATVRMSYLQDADVGEHATVGPFAYLRPGAVLAAGAKVGAYVEVKNSRIGAGTKVPHLSYIGDADIGENSNLGAGTITANYDGRAKHRTTIGSNVRGGVDTSFVAPVTVGDGAQTAAGSVITEDVPPGALAIARSRQSNIAGYAQRPPKAPPAR